MIVIVDDIMVVGKKPNHSNHDEALTTLLETARKCNVPLNYKKLQYKKQEADIFGETYTTTVASQIRKKSQQSERCLPLHTRSKYNPLLG